MLSSLLLGGALKHSRNSLCILVLGELLCLLSTSCRISREQESTPAFFTYVSRGHEDITRFAIDMANQQLERDFDIVNFYPAEPTYAVIAAHADPAHLSTNPIIYGNVATDFPKQTILNGVKLADFYLEAPIDSDWLENANYQNFHFMRNFTLNSDQNIATVQDVTDCYDESIAIIIRASVRAGHYWSKSEGFADAPRLAEAHRTAALFLIGHALHTMQDSFSAGHTVRSNDLKNILNICVLRSLEGVCSHRIEIEAKDDIWRDSVIGRLSRGWSDLTPQAQIAATVSARYLVHLALSLTKGGSSPWSKEREDNLENIVKDYLKNPSFDRGFSGYLNLAL